MSFRAEHLGLLQDLADKDRLVLAGPFMNPSDSSAFLFKGDDDSDARAFVEADPYVKNGLVKGWVVREWMTVVGEGASAPVTL